VVQYLGVRPLPLYTPHCLWQGKEKHHFVPKGQSPRTSQSQPDTGVSNFTVSETGTRFTKGSEDQGDIQQVSFQPPRPGLHFLPQSNCYGQMLVHIFTSRNVCIFFWTNVAYYTNCSAPCLSHFTIYLRNDSISTHINWSLSFKHYKMIFMLRSFFDCL